MGEGEIGLGPQQREVSVSHLPVPGGGQRWERDSQTLWGQRTRLWGLGTKEALAARGYDRPWRGH